MENANVENASLLEPKLLFDGYSFNAEKEGRILAKHMVRGHDLKPSQKKMEALAAQYEAEGEQHLLCAYNLETHNILRTNSMMLAHRAYAMAGVFTSAAINFPK